MTTRIRRARAAVPAIALAGLLAAGCTEDTPETGTAADTAAEEEVTAEAPATDEPEDIDEEAPLDDPVAEAANILDNPEEYVGEQVTAPGQVDQVISDYLFTIAPTDADQDALLVLHDGSAQVSEGLDVAVMGEVMPSLEIEEAEAFVGQDVDDALIGTYAGDVYVQASEVQEAGATS